jgi:hypothetical protein
MAFAISSAFLASDFPSFLEADKTYLKSRTFKTDNDVETAGKTS